MIERRNVCANDEAVVGRERHTARQAQIPLILIRPRLATRDDVVVPAPVAEGDPDANQRRRAALVGQLTFGLDEVVLLGTAHLLHDVARALDHGLGVGAGERSDGHRLGPVPHRGVYDDRRADPESRHGDASAPLPSHVVATG